MLTDCPTREKLGWTNDAQASLEQIMFNFDCESFFENCLVDICDTMNKEGDLAGIAPTPEWGYGHGPVCNGIICILPYLFNKNLGNKKVFLYALPYMKRYFSYLKNSANDFELYDWEKPKATSDEDCIIEKEFIRKAYLFIFSRIFIGFGEPYEQEYKQAQTQLLEYIVDDRCRLETQTAISVCIVLGIGNKQILGKQLIEVIKKDNNHFNCGMFGMPYLFKALKDIEKSELAYEMITNESAPSYKVWIDKGATTLWETFREKRISISKNHHMFSCVLYFFIEGICGLKQQTDNKFLIKPSFVPALSCAECSKRTKRGEVYTKWQRNGNEICLQISAKGNVIAQFNGETIKNASKVIFIKD